MLDEAIRKVHGRVLQYEFSPDGQRVVFVATRPFDESGTVALGAGFRNGTENSGLYITGRDGSIVRPLLTGWGELNRGNADPGTPGAPRWFNLIGWSPDGTSVAFSVQVVSAKYPDKLSDVPRERMVEESRKAYETILAVVDSNGGTPRQIGASFDSRAPILSDPWWSPDGKSLVYLRYSDGGVLSRGLDGSEKLLTSLKLPAQLRMNQQNLTLGGQSPDGRWIAFTQKRDEGGVERDLWLLPAKGGDPVRLTGEPLVTGWQLGRERSSAKPAWSADSRAVYYLHHGNLWKISIDPRTGQRVGEAGQVTFYEDAKTSAPRVLLNGRGFGFALEKSQSVVKVLDTSSNMTRPVARGLGAGISPDGKTIYYVGEGPSQSGILALSLSDGSVRQLVAGETSQVGAPYMPVQLSPDGRHLSYVAGEGKDQAVFVVPTGGGTPRRIGAMEGSWCKCATWSPLGNELAYVNGSSLMVAPVDGGEPREIGRLRAFYDGSPQWAPDGKSIAILGWGENERADSVYLFSTSGGAVRRLTPYVQNGSDKECLTWHPDGERLVFFDYKDDRNHEVTLDGQIGPPLFDHKESWEYCGEWSRDGSVFQFVGSVSGVWRPFTYNPKDQSFSTFSSPAENTVSVGNMKWSSDRKTAVWWEERVIRQVWLKEMN